MTLDGAIKHCLEVAEKNECKMTSDDGYTDVSMKQCAADHRQLAEWLTELKELREENEKLMSQVCELQLAYNNELVDGRKAKILLKAAVKDIGDMSRYCLGINCDHCPHIHTLSRGYQSCIWQHEEEALKLIGEDGESNGKDGE